MWYKFFGGRKAYQGLVAAGLGVMAWFTMPIAARVTNLFQFLLFWAACLSVYAYSNIKEHQLNNGSGNK